VRFFPQKTFSFVVALSQANYLKWEIGRAPLVLFADFPSSWSRFFFFNCRIFYYAFFPTYRTSMNNNFTSNG